MSAAAAEADRALDAAVGDRLQEVGATDRRGQAGMDLALRGADVVVDVLAEVAHRQVAGLAVVPLEREVEILRFQRLQAGVALRRSEEHTSELQSLMRISYAVFCLKKT